MNPTNWIFCHHKPDDIAIVLFLYFVFILQFYLVSVFVLQLYLEFCNPAASQLIQLIGLFVRQQQKIVSTGLKNCNKDTK